jgi:hypothetical protein
MKKEILDELIVLYKQEKNFLSRSDRGLWKSTVDPTVEKIKEKVPENLANVLETAFFKAFKIVYEKGYDYIEKTYDKDKLQLEHQLNNYRLDKETRKRYLKQLDKQAGDSKVKNSLLSMLEGGVLGFLGIGIPDIPLLIAMIIKTVTEIGFSYGYNCDRDSESETAYILLLISAAVSRGEQQEEFNRQVNQLGDILYQSPNALPEEYNLEQLMEQAAKVLSEAMLSAKFVQGIAVVGIVGGMVNFIVINKIAEYARLKYKRRYLLGKGIEGRTNDGKTIGNQKASTIEDNGGTGGCSEQH